MAMPTRPWSAFCAVVVTALLAYGYAGPVLCASVHGHDAAAAPHGQHGHHAMQVPTGASALSPAADHTGGCPDMQHCGLTLMGPAGTGAPPLLVAPPSTIRPLASPTPWLGMPTSPTTPPPKA